eukprot:4322882-Pyramimonas_sp.AAC.1
MASLGGAIGGGRLSHSFTTCTAVCVFPVPGGPCSSATLGAVGSLLATASWTADSWLRFSGAPRCSR